MTGTSNNSEVLIEIVKTSEQLQEAYEVRLEVFVEEQKVPLDEEIDALDTDPTTTHVIARDAQTGSALGTARLLPTPDRAGHFHIGRVAVRKVARGRNVGALLMGSLERVAATTHSDEVVVELSAQIQAAGFYRKLGYQQSSEEQYLDAGILHVDMRKVVQP